MFDDKIGLINSFDLDNFKILFEIRGDNKDYIYYNDFIDIVLSHDKFECPILGEILDRLKKLTKQRLMGFEDKELYLCKYLLI
jgi:hypothetical protein